MARVRERQAQGFDERTLPYAGWAGQPDANAPSCLGDKTFQDLLAARLILGSSRLDRRDRTRECPALARTNGAANGIGRVRRSTQGQARFRSRTTWRTARADLGIGVPGPKIPATPFSLR